jgi:hypothetical protein
MSGSIGNDGSIIEGILDGKPFSALGILPHLFE